MRLVALVYIARHAHQVPDHAGFGCRQAAHGIVVIRVGLFEEV